MRGVDLYGRSRQHSGAGGGGPSGSFLGVPYGAVRRRERPTPAPVSEEGRTLGPRGTRGGVEPGCGCGNRREPV